MNTIDKIFDTLKEEITKITNENNQLKEDVRSLQAALKEKNDDYKRIAAIFKEQSEHWRKVTAKLMANRRNKREEEVESVEVEVEKSEIVAVIDDESTQLPTQNNDKKDTDTQTQSPPPQEATQSHLDTLISLISDSSYDEEENDIVHNNNHVNNVNQSNHFESLDYRPRKRKSHSRGCPCCDKFYQATRPAASCSSPRTADSFLGAPKTPPGFWDTCFTPRQ